MTKPPKDRSHLKLVASVTTQQQHVQQIWERIANREFNSGSWEEVERRRPFFLEHNLSVPDVTDNEAKATHVKQAILAILEEESRLSSALIEEQFLEIAWQDLVQTPFISADPITDPGGNMLCQITENTLRRTIDLFKAKAHHTLSCEELGQRLYSGGIFIANSDLTRLLVAELNRDHLVPQVLVLPNLHHTYNPTLLRLTNERRFSPKARNFLRLFRF